MFPPFLQLVFITGTYIAILIFDGLSVCLYFPANVLVISYCCLMFPLADASYASLARSSMTFSLSVFTLFLTALFAFLVYFSRAVAFAALFQLLLIAPFFSFPSSLALC